MKTAYYLYRGLRLIPSLWRRHVTDALQKKCLASCGRNVSFGDNLIMLGHENISIGDDVTMGPNCVVYAVLAPLTIGRGVMIGPNVTIMTGEHRTDVIGEYMRNITNDMKLPKNDTPVVIEDDVWIGSNVTVLKGSTIGRGSVIHAGSVVSGKVKPYTIYISRELQTGRFSDEEIQEHEALLKEKYHVVYPEYHPKKDTFLQ